MGKCKNHSPIIGYAWHTNIMCEIPGTTLIAPMTRIVKSLKNATAYNSRTKKRIAYFVAFVPDGHYYVLFQSSNGLL